MFFLQAFQIDIETWRRVSMMIGMVWDMEAARLCWDGARARSLKPAPDGGIPEAWSGWR